MNKRFAFILVLLSLITWGCAGPSQVSSPSAMPYVPPSRAPAYEPLPAAEGGFYHTVARGETLWRISKTYGVNVQELMKTNGIADTRHIATGRRLWIPAGRAPEIKIPLFADTGHWKYIVIHHTATFEGDARTIEVAHRKRGFGSMGYHFLIDNGSKGKYEGHIEVGPRWYSQSNGAHANKANMNEIGIGIALVGNFSVKRISDRQMDALVSLTRTLMRQYSIPASHVVAHRDVPGASTECPGKHFPWSEFRSKL